MLHAVLHDVLDRLCSPKKIALERRVLVKINYEAHIVQVERRLERRDRTFDGLRA